MPKKPRPNKIKLPNTKPTKQADFNDAVWAAIKSLEAHTDRVIEDEDARSAKAAALRKK